MKQSVYIIIGMALLLFASCGQRHKVKSSVKEFISDQMNREVRYLDFSKVDSTRALSDSLIRVMRSKGGKNILYKNPSGTTLLHISAQYVLESDTVSATFYLDPASMRVVAYKEN